MPGDDRTRQSESAKAPQLSGGSPLLRGPIQPSPPGVPLQFSLETLLVVTTLVAVCLGISVAVPPLGIPISIVVLAGLIRTLVIGRQHLYLGIPFPIGEKIAEFIISCGVIVGAIGVGGLTLFFTCCVGGMAASSMDRLSQTGNPGSVGNTIGSVVAVAYLIVAAVAPIFTTIWFLWATRPR